MSTTTFKKGSVPREELQLPILYFVSVDQWMDVIGEKAILAWLRFYTWCDRTEEGESTNKWEEAKIPTSLTKIRKKLGIGKDTFWNQILKPLWNVGLIDLEEYEDSTAKGQKPINIIVYKYPQNNISLASKKIVMVRNYDKDYHSAARVYALKGGRSKKEAELNLEGMDVDMFPQKPVDDFLVDDGDSLNKGDSTPVLYQNPPGSISEPPRFCVRTAPGSVSEPNNIFNVLTNNFNYLYKDFNYINNLINHHQEETKKEDKRTEESIIEKYLKDNPIDDDVILQLLLEKVEKYQPGTIDYLKKIHHSAIKEVKAARQRKTDRPNERIDTLPKHMTEKKESNQPSSKPGDTLTYGELQELDKRLKQANELEEKIAIINTWNEKEKTAYDRFFENGCSNLIELARSIDLDVS